MLKTAPLVVKPEGSSAATEGCAQSLLVDFGDGDNNIGCKLSRFGIVQPAPTLYSAEISPRSAK